ncbi:MAG: hypothetical protein JWM98_2925, partial [Thermoleophilia bacterium]|nr:hypothetical protein [Thermoleophilia bacterium]
AVVPTTQRQRDYAELGIPSQRLLDVVDRGDTVLASAEWADYVRLRTGARVVVDARLERFRARDLDAYLDFVDHADGRLARQVHADVVLVHRRTLGDDWPNPRHDVDLGATRLQHAAHDHTGDALRVTD